ncbi:hypothetical protein QBC39DRAFT_388923 [Podospora conica]|nr:hypothetical protein QBC39DRAFT_388923 [Schizothecium conicum]
MADNNNNPNGVDDEDEAIRIAIALSLGQDPTAAASKSTVDLTGPEEDDGDDECRIVEPTLIAKTKKEAPSNTSATATPNPISAPSLPAAPSSFSLLVGLDRKKMEEERLARAAKKRKADDQLGSAGEGGDRPHQRIKVENESSAPAVAASSATVAQTGSGSSAGKSSNGEVPFPRGVVKRTWCNGQPRTGDDIKIEEVLQKDKLELAVLSSFQWDEEWLLTKVDIERTKMVLIAFANDERQRQEMQSNVPRNRIRFCFPPMLPMGAMHSKLQLLKFEGYLRIVVPTGNLMPYDWGETGVMENMVFIIDLPRFESAEQREAQTLTPFAEEILYFLRMQTLDEKLLKSLRNYDFSETSRYGFVHSMAGSYSSAEAWKRTGYCGLGRAVVSLGLQSRDPLQLDYVCASIGAVKYDLLRALYYACQGDSGLKEYESRSTGRKGKDIAKADDDTDVLNKNIRVYFPSLETVNRSKRGKNSAGTICLESRWWNATTFPQQVLRDSRSTRSGILLHSKVLFATRPSADGSASAFAYVGSANLSESAWGRLTMDRSTHAPKMTCRNWECGVLVKAGEHGSSNGSANSLGMFEGVVPVPMQLPALPLAKEGDRMPWFVKDNY